MRFHLLTEAGRGSSSSAIRALVAWTQRACHRTRRVTERAYGCPISRPGPATLFWCLLAGFRYTKYACSPKPEAELAALCLANSSVWTPMPPTIGGPNRPSFACADCRSSPRPADSGSTNGSLPVEALTSACNEQVHARVRRLSLQLFLGLLARRLCLYHCGNQPQHEQQAHTNDVILAFIASP